MVKEKKSKNKKKEIIITTIAILLIVILLLVCWSKFQDWVFFHPWNDMVAYRKLANMDEFQEIEIVNDEFTLSGWLWKINQENEPAPLVIFFTGNAQNSSNTLYNYYSSRMLANVFGKYNVMIVDYPGYGMSTGKTSEENMYLASDYIFEYASQMDEVDKDNIVIMGYSVGTGVACYCASQHNASGLILMAPYDKANSLYNDYIDSFHGSMSSLAKYKLNSAAFAEEVTAPTLIFTSKSDEVIDYSHSLDLAGHFSGLDDVIILDGVSHNGYISQIQVQEGIQEFLNRILER